MISSRSELVLFVGDRDSRGMALRERLVHQVCQWGLPRQVIDSPAGIALEAVDSAKQLAETLRLRPEALGIVIADDVQRLAIALNRLSTIRACWGRTLEEVGQARAHLNANVLCITNQPDSEETWLSLCEGFIKIPFLAGQYTTGVHNLTVSATPHSEQGINLIVRALIVQDHQILLTTATEYNLHFATHLFFLPGGHVDHNESCLAALKRELFEEMAATIAQATFKGTLECSWDRQGRLYHELNIIYQVTIDGLDRQQPPDSLEPSQRFVWVPLDQLSQKHLLPESLQALIPQALCGEPPHFYSEMTGSRLTIKD